MKNKITRLLVVSIGLIFLTGCGIIPGLGVSKKTEAVNSAKAEISGLLQGDKTAYESYYGQGKYDEHIKEIVNRKGMFLNQLSEKYTEEEKKKQLASLQKLLARTKVEYAEQSESEVVISIHQMKCSKEEAQAFMEKKNYFVNAGTHIGTISKYLEEGISEGAIKYEEKEVIKKTLKVIKNGNKLTIDSQNYGEITDAMFTIE